MKLRLLLSLLILALAMTPSAPAVAAQEAPEGPPLVAGYVPGEVLVKLVAPADVTASAGGALLGVASVDGILQAYGVTGVEQLFPETSEQGLDAIYKVTFPVDRDVLEMVAALSGDPAVRFAEPNHIYHLSDATLAAPDDTLYTMQWHLNNTGQTGGRTGADLRAADAWAVTTGAADVLIAVIDSGIDYRHEDLDDGRVRTDIDWDYVNFDDDAMDDNGHGTHVAGSIAAESNNGVGVTGLMWQASLVAFKVCDRTGSCASDAIAKAIRQAAHFDVDIINMSLGGSCSQTIADAVNYAYFDHGMTIVAAAGNSAGGVSYPAAFPPVIAVGAVDYNDRLAYFSNFGPEIDVVAPGVNVLSTIPNNNYETYSGTSMASPQVAAVAGLILAQHPGIDNDTVRALVRQAVDDLGAVGFDIRYGYGRINAAKAVTLPVPTAGFHPMDANCATDDCGVEVALRGAIDGDALLAGARALRDTLLAEAPGRIWTHAYYAHRAEVAWIVASDPELAGDVAAGLRELAPLMQALADDDPLLPPTVVTEGMVEAAKRAVDGIARRSSTPLRATIEQEWGRLGAERFVGWEVRSAWEQVRREAQERRLYLPAIAN